MNELPKSVIRRLAEPRSSTLAHPDADLLTAFVERSLSPVEYGNVMAHLGDCRECRQVISLAVPETAPGLQAVVVRSRSFWRWPVLQWGAMAVTATVLLAVAGLVLRPELLKRNPQQTASSVTVHTGPSVGTLNDRAGQDVTSPRAQYA